MADPTSNNQKAYNLSLKSVCDMLGKSERTVYRYVRNGRLSVRHILTEKGRQIRFNEEEVAKLRQTLTSGGRPDNSGVSDTMAGGIYQELMQKYEQVLVQLGYYRAKSEEIKLLEERAASLQAKATEWQEKATKLEAERQILAGEIAKAQEAIKRKEQQLRRFRMVFLSLILIFAGFLVALPWLNTIVSWLKRWL